MKTKKLTALAMLTAISLVIFIIEAQLPPLAPIPGIKLGLANIITLIAMARFGRREAFLVLMLRITLGSIFAGQMMSLLYSLTGGILCFAVMALLIGDTRGRFSCGSSEHKKTVPLHSVPLWAVSVFGAIAHNIGQVAVAAAITKIGQVAVYLPLLLISAVITGAFTGGVATVILKNKSIWRSQDEN